MKRKCTTVKPGTPCVHMGKKACTYPGGECLPVIEACEGCENTAVYKEKSYCEIYANPAQMWKDDDCLSATHVERKIVSVAQEQKINPLKASKRASRGR